MSSSTNIIAFLIAGAMVVGVFLVTSPGSDSRPESREEAGVLEGELFDDDISDTFILMDWKVRERNSVGNPNAPIVMEQYSDYTCKFCFDFWRDVMPQLKAEFIDTGRVRYVYNDFISFGGQRAAEAAWCAEEQDAFWQYHDVLYSRFEFDRNRWDLPEVHGVYAKELGLDVERLVQCFQDRRYKGLVEESYSEALEKGIVGAPFFSINGKLIGGFRDFEFFKDILLEELGGRGQ